VDIDILAALESDKITRGPRACPIQKWLNGVPDDTAGKAELESILTTGRDRLAEPSYRTMPQILTILSRLNFYTSESSIGDHRAARCACYR
jgi:hypothetical protein